MGRAAGVSGRPRRPHSRVGPGCRGLGARSAQRRRTPQWLTGYLGPARHHRADRRPAPAARRSSCARTAVHRRHTGHVGDQRRGDRSRASRRGAGGRGPAVRRTGHPAHRLSRGRDRRRMAPSAGGDGTHRAPGRLPHRRRGVTGRRTVGDRQRQGLPHDWPRGRPLAGRPLTGEPAGGPAPADGAATTGTKAASVGRSSGDTGRDGRTTPAHGRAARVHLWTQVGIRPTSAARHVVHGGGGAVAGDLRARGASARRMGRRPVASGRFVGHDAHALRQVRNPRPSAPGPEVAY